MPHLLHPYKLVMGGDIAPVVQSNFALSAYDFDSLSSTSTMPPGGSISRAGNAMLYDSTGKLTYAPNNQCLQSQTFSSGSWIKNQMTVSANVAVAPDGTSTASKFIATNTSTGPFSYQSVSNAPASVFSFYAKSSEYYLVRAMEIGGFAYYATFNLNTGVITASGGSAFVSAGMVSVGNGWWRCYIRVNAVASQAISFMGFPDTITPPVNTPAVYTGDGVSGTLFWGAQFEAVTYQTSPSTYVATTSSAYYGPRFDYDPVTLQPKGLLVEGQLQQLVNYTQDFSNAYWTKSGTITPTYNAYTSPDGTLNASRFASTTQFDSVSRSISSLTIGSAYTFSMWVRLVSGSSTLNLNIDEGGANVNRTQFTATSTWQRVSVTRIITSGTATVSIQNREVTASTFECFGAQLELRAFPTSYIPAASSGSSPFNTRAAETFSLTGYANRLVEAYYIDEETGANFSGNSALSTGTVTISPPTFGWITSLRAYQNAYAGSISTPSWLSFSRAGGAMYYDSTGTLTWASENLLLNSATLSTQSVVVTSPTVTTAGQLGSNYILSFKGTGSVAITGTSLVFYTGSSPLAGTGASNRVSACFFAAQGTLTFTVTGTVTEAQLERVTYQTAPSAYIPTTSAAVYGPRYDYDPSTVPATPRGLLIEESRANLQINSQKLDTSGTWVTSSVSISASGISPDGATSSYLFYPTASGNTSIRVLTTVNVSIGTTYTASIYVKYAGKQWVFMASPDAASSANNNWFDVLNGVVGSKGVNTTATSITSVGNGWYRITATSVATTAFNYIYITTVDANSSTSVTASGTSGVYLWGAQLEAGSFATSYIPTTSANVTRAADVAQLTGSALTTLQGTNASLGLEYYYARNGCLWDLEPVAAGAFLTMSAQGVNGTGWYAAGLATMTAPTLNAVNRQFIGWNKTGNFSGSTNNSATVSSSACDYTGLSTSSYLGSRSGGSTSINSYVCSLAIYNQKLPDAILKQKSSVGAPY